MKKRYVPTFLALMLFVGLLTWTLTRERGRVPDKEEVFRGEIARASDVTGIEVVRFEPLGDQDSDESESESDAEQDTPEPGEMIETRRLAFEKRGDEWYVTQPYEGLMDPEVAEQMVTSVVELKPSVREDADPTAQEYGLDAPVLQVTASLTGGGQITVSLGEDTPVGGRMFARISDKQGLFLVPSSFRQDMDKDPDTVRDKKVARFERDEVVKATFMNRHGTIVAERRKMDREKDHWYLTSPEEYKGDEWAVTSAFNKIAELDVREHLPYKEDLSEYGLDRPQAYCKVELTDGRVYEVSVGKTIKKQVPVSEFGDTEEERELVYVLRRGRPEVLLVERSLLDDLERDAMAFRDKRLLDFARDSVLSLRVARQQGLSFSVMRAGDQWTIQSPSTGRASQTKVEDILWDLADLEALEYVEPRPDLRQVGLAVPHTVITLTLRGNRQIQVKIGDEIRLATDSHYYCSTSESDDIYKISDMTMKDLPERVEDLEQGAMDAPMMDDLDFGMDWESHDPHLGDDH